MNINDKAWNLETKRCIINCNRIGNQMLGPATIWNTTHFQIQAPIRSNHKKAWFFL
uniref:Uncharacterized protein n=1 Tax=Rhizophora mucronata TaxID=61149 RepID=A0A2P2NDJ2_RHIMU